MFPVQDMEQSSKLSSCRLEVTLCRICLQPHLVSKLIVEDVSPTVSRLTGATSFPEFFRAMRNINFDQSARTLADVRKETSKLLKDVIPVSTTYFNARQMLYRYHSPTPKGSFDIRLN